MSKLRRKGELDAHWEDGRSRLAALWSRPGYVERARLSLEFEQDSSGVVREYVVTERIVSAPDGIVVNVNDLRSGYRPAPDFGDAPIVFLFLGKALAVTAHGVESTTTLRSEIMETVERCAGGGYYWGSEFKVQGANTAFGLGRDRARW